MKIVYTKILEANYPANPVENSDRVHQPEEVLRECGWPFVELWTALPEDIARVHGQEHI